MTPRECYALKFEACAESDLGAKIRADARRLWDDFASKKPCSHAGWAACANAYAVTLAAKFDAPHQYVVQAFVREVFFAEAVRRHQNVNQMGVC